MQRLYFVRHGLSRLNELGLYAGRTETPLTPMGRAQAKQAGIYAIDLGINLIITSPLSRAYDTASIIARQIGYPKDMISVNDMVIERNFGELEASPWAPNMDHDSFPGVEKDVELIARAQKVYDHLKTLEAHDNILVVSHGAFGRAMRHVADPSIPFRGPGISSLPNAQIIRLL